MNSHFQNNDDECLPIKSLEDLRSWRSYVSKLYNVHPLQKRQSPFGPKTLLCHDMKGGYLDDRFLNGTANEDNYYFLHWSMIDIFVYFSHHFVTIPPCGWISAAHQNGVKILGTFITERDAGTHICESIFCDTATVHECCLELIRIAKFYNFDGWLINIENKLNITQIPLLEEFMHFLTLKMHESKEGSLVIWYDSVIDSGELKWQNAVNQHNRNFFLLSDGIFLNYNWTTDTLRASAAEAGSRKKDVFVGVDVFGRGCLGGGGFSTDIAVTAAREFDLSVAIFAPGWVHEVLDVKDFKENQYRFWDNLVELCAPRVITGLPYYSTFCPGFGKKVFRLGKVEHSRPWFNLSLQQPQPSFHSTNCQAEGAVINLHTEDAFNGGGCLKLTYKIPENVQVVNFDILSTNFIVKSACSISYTFKSLNKDAKVALVLGISDGDKKFFHLKLSEQSHTQTDAKYVCWCSSCMSEEGNCSYSTSPEIIRHSDEDLPWITRKYRVYLHKFDVYYVKRVQLQIMRDEVAATEVSVLLGELLISPSLDYFIRYRTVKITPKDESNVDVECILEWSSEQCIDSSDLYIYIDNIKYYICTTTQRYYKLNGCFRKRSDVQFFLSPKCSGKMLDPMFLKLSLDE